jgi:hypothetical protein
VDRARAVFDDELRPRDEADRERDDDEELREPDVLPELAVFRALEPVFVLPLLEPFREVDLERLDLPGRRLVLVVAGAIYSSISLSRASFPGIWAYPRKPAGNDG